MTDPSQSDDVQWEKFDPETGEVLGTGRTLRATVEAVIAEGRPFRIVRELSPGADE